MAARTSAADRAEISRKNGCMGRGPTSPEGKARSRMNAIKHGMTARIPVLPGEDPETYRQTVDGIVDSLSPRNALELALAEQAATCLWKIERAERVEATRAAATIRAAAAKEEAHQREELHALGRWLLANTVRTKREAAEDLLAFLPEDRQAPFRAGRGEPLAILLRVEATTEGCSWLLERWDRLRGRLEQEGGWDIEEMIEAAQLRGERPLYTETAEWECLVQERHTADNPALVEEGRRQLVDQLTEGLSGDRAGTSAALRRLVEEETARLEELEAACREREAVNRRELADRLAVDTTAEGAQVQRYQLDCDRKLHRAVNTLVKLRRCEGVGVAGEPAPDGSPEPEPMGTVETLGGPEDEADAEVQAGRVLCEHRGAGPGLLPVLAEHPTTPRSWAPPTLVEPDPGPVGTVEPLGVTEDGPNGEADAAVRPETNGESREHDEPVAGGSPPVSGVGSPSTLEARRLAPAGAVAAAELVPARHAPPRRPAAEPEGHAVAQNEPGPAAGGGPIRPLMSGIRCSTTPADPSAAMDHETCARAAGRWSGRWSPGFSRSG